MENCCSNTKLGFETTHANDRVFFIFKWAILLKIDIWFQSFASSEIVDNLIEMSEKTWHRYITPALEFEEVEQTR